MNYLFKNNFKILMRKKRLYLAYLFIVIMYFLLNSNVIEFLDMNCFKCILGIGLFEEGAFLENIFLMSSCGIVIYYTIYLYLFFVIDNIQNILLRMEKNKFALFNYLIIIFYMILLELSVFVIVTFLARALGTPYSLKEFMALLKYCVLFCVMISLISILIINSWGRGTLFYLASFASVILFLLVLFKDLTSLNIIYFILGDILLFGVNILTFNPSKIYDKYQHGL